LTGPKSKTLSPKPTSKGGQKEDDCKCGASTPTVLSKHKGGACGSSGPKTGIEGYTTKHYASATGGTKPKTRTKKI
jgi:hypothetical protein